MISVWYWVKSMSWCRKITIFHICSIRKIMIWMRFCTTVVNMWVIHMGICSITRLQLNFSSTHLYYNLRISGCTLNYIKEVTNGRGFKWGTLRYYRRMQEKMRRLQTPSESKTLAKRVKSTKKLRAPSEKLLNTNRPRLKAPKSAYTKRALTGLIWAKKNLLRRVANTTRIRPMSVPVKGLRALWRRVVGQNRAEKGTLRHDIRMCGDLTEINFLLKMW